MKKIFYILLIFFSHYNFSFSQPRTYDAFYGFRLFDKYGQLISDTNTSYKMLPLANRIEKQDSFRLPHHYKFIDYVGYYFCFQNCNQNYKIDSMGKFFQFKIVNLKDTMEILCERSFVFDSIPFSSGKYVFTLKNLYEIEVKKSQLNVISNNFINWSQYKINKDFKKD